MLLPQDDRDQTMLTITKENQSINKDIVEGLLDPKGHVSKLFKSRNRRIPMVSPTTIH